MAQDDRTSSGFFSTFMHSSAGQRLAEQARSFAQAQAQRATDKVSSGMTSAGGKLGDVAESGSLPPMGEGIKRLASGDSPAKAALGTAVHTVGDKVKGGLEKITGGRKKGGGKAKSVNIIESIDVGVPVRTAYDQWTQFQDFARYMKGVESVEQTSDTEQNWRAKVFKSKRTWKATVQEQIPDERIVWSSEGAKGSTKGVVTFHELDDNLTRVLLDIEYFPQGLFEKTGNIWRAAGRRARLDLKHYRRFVMMEGEATGSWRGEIRDGEVVKSPEDAEQEENENQDNEDQQNEEGSQGDQAAQDSGQGEEADQGDEGDEAEQGDEAEAESDEGAQDSDESDEAQTESDEEEEEEQPSQGASAGRSRGGSAQRRSGSGGAGQGGAGQGGRSRRQPAKASS